VFLKNAERPFRLSKILLAEGFLPEAFKPFKESFNLILNAFIFFQEDNPASKDFPNHSLSQLKKYDLLTEIQDLSLIINQEENSHSPEQQQIKDWLSCLNKAQDDLDEKITQELLH